MWCYESAVGISNNCFDCASPINFENGFSWLKRIGKHLESPVCIYIEVKSTPICCESTLTEKTQSLPVQIVCSFCYLHVRCSLCSLFLIRIINGLFFFCVANLYRKKKDREMIKDCPPPTFLSFTSLSSNRQTEQYLKWSIVRSIFLKIAAFCLK